MSFDFNGEAPCIPINVAGSLAIRSCESKEFLEAQHHCKGEEQNDLTFQQCWVVGELILLKSRNSIILHIQVNLVEIILLTEVLIESKI